MVNGFLKQLDKLKRQILKHKPQDLHLEILPAATKRAFLALSKTAWLKKSRWYLAGGTALALQAGHRQSVDLDFFTAKKNFDIEELESDLRKLGKWETTSKDEGTLYGKLFGAKISFIAYPFFRPSAEKIRYGNIGILTADDIAAMKIIAISQRGRKRDFLDLYWYCNNIADLKGVLSRVLKQYPQMHNMVHLLNSLTYFDDAEKDAMPPIRFLAKWDDIKSWFRRTTALIARKFLGLE